MQVTDFTEHAPGKLSEHPAGYIYFAPAQLPPKIQITWELTDDLLEAERSLAELSGLARTLPNPNLLIAPLARREAVLSSRMEGTQASLSDLFFFEAAPQVQPDAADTREVYNYVRALEYGLERLDQLPLSLRLIREIHKKLMTGVRGESARPGEFRDGQNWIGVYGSTVDEASYVPPAPREMHECLASLERYLHQEPKYPTLIELALIHYQFEAIHPFLDGNGRVGRLLIPLILSERSVISNPLLYLSAFFERNRLEYNRRLFEVSRTGQWVEWGRFFLRAVKEQSRDAVWRTELLLNYLKHSRAAIESTRSSARLLTLVDRLFVSPVVTAADAVQLLDVTYGTAIADIEKLEAAGIVREATGRKRNRIYVADEIVDIVDRKSPVESG